VLGAVGAVGIVGLVGCSATESPILSPLALPKNIGDAVYAIAGYRDSLAAMSRTTLQNDTVFRDGWESQTSTVTGDVAAGYLASLKVPV
jgi:hypothetical protein